MSRLPELQERRAYECRLTPDRALATIDEADAFLRDLWPHARRALEFAWQGWDADQDGVIEGEQGDKQGKERNDRIIAIQQDAHSWADIKTIDDLGKQFCRELEAFFVNYHKLTGKEYRVLGLKGPDQARKLVKSGGQ